MDAKKTEAESTVTQKLEEKIKRRLEERRARRKEGTHASREARIGPPDADFAGGLRDARSRGDAEGAEAVIVRALEHRRAHTFDPDDLVWVARTIGLAQSSWRAGQAIAHWLYHHGPVNKPILQVAEDIALYDNAEWLDAVLLWIEPTPDRWYQHACWSTMLCGWELGDRLRKEGKEAADNIIEDPEQTALYKSCAVDGFSAHPRLVSEARGESARRTLRVAACLADYDSEARLILEAWSEALA